MTISGPTYTAVQIRATQPETVMFRYITAKTEGYVGMMFRLMTWQFEAMVESKQIKIIEE